MKFNGLFAVNTKFKTSQLIYGDASLSTAVCVRLMLLSGLISALLASLAPVRTLAQDPVAALDRPVLIMAREQPVGQFLGDVLGQVGVPVWVDDSVRGPVNGDFEKPAAQVLEDVRRAFQLTYYYDGAVLYVYPANAIDRKVMYLSRSVAQGVISSAEDLRLPDKTNRLELASMGLIATGTRRFLEQVSELADALKTQAADARSPETFRVFNLKYGWADDVSLVVGGQKVVIPGVASMLVNLVGADGVGASANGRMSTGGVQRALQSPTRPKLKGEGLQSVGNEQTQDVELAPVAVEPVTTVPGINTGRVRIVADPLNNAVVIRDRADRMDSYERLIASLDVEPLMVEVEATIIDMNTERLRELGVDWRLQYGIRNNPVDATVDSLAGDGGIVSLVLGNKPRFLASVRALEEQGAARIVSKPHVITLANVEAVLDSTSTFYVRVAGQEEVDLFDVSVGTTMRVTPHVLEGQGGSQIKMLVSIEDGTASDERVDQIPVIDRSTINTQALVEEGQSLLIGGLIRETDLNRVAKVPLLGDIPGVGALFRSNVKSARHMERLFLITPRITMRTVAGNKRLDAPVVYGNEGEIISSAPIRLKALQAPLQARDEGAPVVPVMPQSSVEATLAKPEKSAQPAVAPETLITQPRRAPVKLQPTNVNERKPGERGNNLNNTPRNAPMQLQALRTGGDEVVDSDSALPAHSSLEQTDAIATE